LRVDARARLNASQFFLFSPLSLLASPFWGSFLFVFLLDNLAEMRDKVKNKWRTI
jgi:hypothetical protein